MQNLFQYAGESLRFVRSCFTLLLFFCIYNITLMPSAQAQKSLNQYSSPIASTQEAYESAERNPNTCLDLNISYQVFMGKIGGTSWLNIVKKAFRSPSKDQNETKSSKRREEQEEGEEKNRGKRRWIFQKPLPHETAIQHNEAENIVPKLNASSSVLGGNLAKNLSAEDAKHEKQCAIAMAMATAVAAESAVAAARAAAEIIQLARPSSSVREHHAAILIQTAFRGYLARRALQALKGIVKLQALVRGYNVRKQAKMTLECMQALIRVQAQVCNQRKRLSSRGSLVCIPRRNSSIGEFRGTSKKFISRGGSTSDDGGDHQYTPKKFHSLLQGTKDAALPCEISLAQAFSRQMWGSNQDRQSAKYEEGEENPTCFDRGTAKQSQEISKFSCDERDSVKIVEIDTIQPRTYSTHNFGKSRTCYDQEQQRRSSSYTVSSPLHRTQWNFPNQSNITNCSRRTKPPEVYSISPRWLQEQQTCSAAQTPTRSGHFTRVNACVNSVPAPQPKYMRATASANAKARSLSVPRHRSLTPEGERKGEVKKRLSFPAPDPLNDIGASSAGSL